MTQGMVWNWQGLAIRYQMAGTEGVPLLCIHGFGASSDHWRRNLPDWGTRYRVYALDLLGFGQSAKPSPQTPPGYTFETWGQQVLDFCREVIGEPAFLVGNSIGCVVAMQAAVMAPAWVRGVALLDCSLRLFHDRKRPGLPWYQRVAVPWLQASLGFRPFGYFFFSRVARPRVVRNLLLQAYGRSEAVTDELVEGLWRPSQDPGAADVFLAFVRYSQGPLPEDLLPHLPCPALLIWGQDDPWEPVALGRELAQYDAVEEFIELAGVGHCPQDEAPEQVNPLVAQWIARQLEGQNTAAAPSAYS